MTVFADTAAPQSAAAVACRASVRAVLVALALALTLPAAAPALAVPPPSVDPDALPPDVTGPDEPLEQRRICAVAADFPESNFVDPPWASTYLELGEAHKFATGAGVTVAVIDTGINASPRIPAEPGGDFIDAAGDGLSDCDAHGTLTASIIGGRPASVVTPFPREPVPGNQESPDEDESSAHRDDAATGSAEPTDAFIGVAPDARLISLRQTSAAFEPVGMHNDSDPNSSPAAGSIRSLARAVTRAANLGAGVINISEAACFRANNPVDESTLGAALNYAVNVKGAVVVVAAGNTGGTCTQNPPPDPADPADPRGWDQVQTIVTPAWYAPLVLTVGGIGPDGVPSGFSMHGPWLGVAAPAQDITALGGNGRPVNALYGNDGLVPIAGTSFAAAYVSGLAALLRQRFPELTPAQIINRITASARHPGGEANNAVGAGVIDPVAALTWDIPPGPVTAPVSIRRIPAPPAPSQPDRGPITGVALGVAGLMLALGAAALTRRAVRRR